jgi:hypothetical protein
MKSKEMDKADARLEEAALVLEGMARELRRLKGQKPNNKTKAPADVPSRATSGGMAEMQVGQRVRVVRKDQCRGRTGVVLGRHGRLFWDVQLDANATNKGCTIYKRGSSLCIIEATE